ncbi:hypothetical protein PV328_003256 [Microctonus aethiopoides]|uniref:Uncharacterized protein n=1 Tax=Microctonus aethiopoides TaxID=144406 RepID=A0AA39F899_9HYME|nr:hypothetical protein PV328_003256 [Microctonus aethiopoides]
MQDDLLIEKQSSAKVAPLSPGGLDPPTGQDQSKDTTEAENIALAPATSPSMDKDITTCGTTTSLQGYTDPVRVPSLWTTEDTGLHALPVNGSLATFQNFPSGGPTLFTSSGARRAITASHNFSQHGNASSMSGRHGQLQVGSQQQVQQQTQQTSQQPPSPHSGVYLQGKSYTAWSGGPQSPQQWSGGSQNTTSPALSPWNRGRSVPNLPPLHSSLHAAAAVAAAAGRKQSPTFPGHPGPNQAHPSNISPVKFRRSTSYPGKGNLYLPQPAPTFEVTAAEERDLLQLPYQQDRMVPNGNSPLENMRTLEHYLSDIMRAGATDTPEHLKVQQVYSSDHYFSRALHEKSGVRILGVKMWKEEIYRSKGIREYSDVKVVI